MLLFVDSLLAACHQNRCMKINRVSVLSWSWSWSWRWSWSLSLSLIQLSRVESVKVKVEFNVSVTFHHSYKHANMQTQLCSSDHALFSLSVYPYLGPTHTHSPLLPLLLLLLLLNIIIIIIINYYHPLSSFCFSSFDCLIRAYDGVQTLAY